MTMNGCMPRGEVDSLSPAHLRQRNSQHSYPRHYCAPPSRMYYSHKSFCVRTWTTPLRSRSWGKQLFATRMCMIHFCCSSSSSLSKVQVSEAAPASSQSGLSWLFVYVVSAWLAGGVGEGVSSLNGVQRCLSTRSHSENGCRRKIRPVSS